MPATWSAFPTTARLRIGDTLTEGEALVFQGVPNFAPEILRRVRLEDAMKAKKLKEACSRWPRKASCSCSRPRTARRRSSAWSARCSSTC
jgi:peptide chain release factor 3